MEIYAIKTPIQILECNKFSEIGYSSYTLEIGKKHIPPRLILILAEPFPITISFSVLDSTFNASTYKFGILI